MWEQRKDLISGIEKRRGSRLVCYITSDRQNAPAIIAKDAIPIFFNQLREIGQVEKVDVLLSTAGGDTLAAFGLARLVREFARSVGVLVPHRCFSAGTLFALGANDIFMTHAGTLSPIDPSITTPLNPANPVVESATKQYQPLPVSVESVAAFKSLLQEEWSIKKEEVLADLFKILAEKVHPLALGDVFRSRQQIQRLARQLLLQHRTDKTKIDKIVATLTKELGSHDYPISRTEACKLMGKQICAEDSELENLVWDLYQDYSREMELDIPHNPATIIARERAKQQSQPGVPVRAEIQLAIIESSSTRDYFQQDVLLSEGMAVGIDARWRRDSC